MTEEVKEDSPIAVNAVGGGGVEGIGYGPMGEPAGKRQVMGLVKRKKLSDIIGKNAHIKDLKKEKD